MENNESAPAPETAGSEQVPLIAASSGAIRLSNGMVGKEFSARIDVGGRGVDVHEIVDAEAARQLDSLGLVSTLVDGVLVLSGTPVREGEHEFRLRASGSEVAVSWFVNSDPRSLWRSLEPDPSLGYRKEHVAASRVTTADFDVYGASRRGRSHAHEGKFREDDFAFSAVGEWLVAVVADGAGSARFSREGSRLACKGAIGSLTESVPKFFNEALERAAIDCAGGDEAANRQVRNVLYQVLCGAAFDAYKMIEQLAGSGSHSIKDYATTLLLTACRRMAEGTLVATFWIGDGAIAVLQEGGRSATLMGRPDGGEFSGQTRFLTMPDIVSDSHEMLQRIEFVLAKDLSAVMLMSDGVSDPKFGTDNRLLSPESWGGLWAEIQEAIAPEDREAPEQRLLRWLDFWSAGEHDDRTLVVIRPSTRS